MLYSAKCCVAIAAPTKGLLKGQFQTLRAPRTSFTFWSLATAGADTRCAWDWSPGRALGRMFGTLSQTHAGAHVDAPCLQSPCSGRHGRDVGAGARHVGGGGYDAMRNVVRSGATEADNRIAHSVHVEVGGLAPRSRSIMPTRGQSAWKQRPRRSCAAGLPPIRPTTNLCRFARGQCRATARCASTIASVSATW
jgi:hypothetical protein